MSVITVHILTRTNSIPWDYKSQTVVKGNKTGAENAERVLHSRQGKPYSVFTVAFKDNARKACGPSGRAQS